MCGWFLLEIFPVHYFKVILPGVRKLCFTVKDTGFWTRELYPAFVLQVSQCSTLHITYFFKSEIIPLSSSCKVNFVHVSSVEEPVGSYLAPAPKNKIVGSGSRSVFYKLTTVLNNYRTESLHCLVEFLRFLLWLNYKINKIEIEIFSSEVWIFFIILP